MRSAVSSFVALAICVTQVVPAGAQPAKPGEGIAPAAIGQACTGPHALRGSRVTAPKDGDVATVPQLCAGGVAVASLAHAPMIVPPATAVTASELDQDQSLPALIALGAPEATGVDIRTVNGNWTHLFSGAFWHAPAITAHGELQAIDHGHAEFSVAAALGYFAVVMPRFLARVRGTIFDVDYEPGQSATFSVSEGSVSIVRLTAVHLEEENRDVDGIRQTDTITAGATSSVHYDLPLKIERTFKNVHDATQAFNEELQTATLNGDPESIDDALNNIQLVSGKPIAIVGGHLAGQSAGGAAASSSSSTFAAIAFAAAAAAAGVVIATKPQASSSAAPVSTPTGSVGLKSTAHAPRSPAPLATTTPRAFGPVPAATATARPR